MKPTYGAVSRTGVFPLSFSLDHVGPLTRTVEDNAILLGAIAGHDPADRSSARRAPPDCLADLHAGVKGLRIGVAAHFYMEDAIGAPEQVAAIAEAADVLRRLGAEVRPVRLPPLARFADCGRTIHFAEAYAVHERDLQQRPEDYAEATRRKLLPGAFISAADYVKAQQSRTELCREFADAMKELDAVITLSSLDLPCRIDDPDTIAKTYERQCRMPFNVTGTPAIAVPTGFTAAGLPLAMQIAGRAFAEPMVYRIAQAYCDATRFYERRPPVIAQAEASLV
jgi:aspartyl-tRNA(Asn)/glutamyl-tRNA(Gln) amidotransferase subunit A